jgi:hypothetical protein
MIENTSDNRDKVCDLMVDSMDFESLTQFVRATLYDTIQSDDEQFRNLLDHLGIETQEELDGDE